MTILFDRYLDKAKCIIEQYSNYTIKEIENLPLNGINTQGENIADNGGIKEAYKAYSKYLIHSYILLKLDKMIFLLSFRTLGSQQSFRTFTAWPPLFPKPVILDKCCKCMVCQI